VLFAKKSAHTFALRILGTLISIGGVAVVTRALGPASKGIYTVLTTTLLILGAFTNCGVGTSNVYLLARKKRELVKVASNSIIFAFVFGLAASLIFLASFNKLKVFLFPGLELSDFLLVIWLLPVIHIQTYFRYILQGLNKIIRLNYIEISFGVIINYSVLILMLYIMHDKVRAVVIGYFIVNVMMAGALAGSVIFNKKFKWKPDWAVAKESLSFGLRERAGEVLDNMVILSDRYFLSYFHGIASVGIYSISCWIAERLWYIPTSIAFVLYPEAASLTGDKSKNFVTVVCRNTLFINAILAILFFLLGKFLIVTLFGYQFADALTPLLLLIPGTLGLTLSITLKTYLLSEGKPLLITYASIVAFVVNMALNFTLIPRYGANGAAIATTTAYILYSGAILCFFVRFTDKKVSEVILIQKEDIGRYYRLIQMIFASILNPVIESKNSRG
jgi:O-antigen/teichoic acid export membrane protein